MPVRFLMNHNVRRAITSGLRLRGVDVITAFEEGVHQLPDPQLLDRATALGRVLFTRDDDLVAEARSRQQEGTSFPGVIYAHQLSVTVGRCIEDLELIASAGEPEDLADQVLFLPLR